MPVKFFRIGSSCSPVSVSALPGPSGRKGLVGFSVCGAAASLEAGAAALVLGESSPANMASQSCESPAPCWDGFAVAGAGAPEAELDEMKSKLLSLPKAVDSLLAWLAGGLLSKTGWKSSRPEREMLAKS